MTMLLRFTTNMGHAIAFFSPLFAAPFNPPRRLTPPRLRDSL